ncbi:MAG: ABC transporter permease [Prevotella sp.]|nr:ABC transporter permease [Prevotella sp.]
MELLSEIWQTARRNKLRTSLTGFAVAWGIFMLLVLLGAGNGLLNAQVQQNERFLSNSMKIFGGFTEKAYHGLPEGRSIPLGSKDLRATQREFSDHIDEVGAEVQAPQSVVVSYGKDYVNARLCGVYPNHFTIDKKEMLCGRFINQIDIQEKRKVVALSRSQAKELNRNFASLVGRHVKVDNFMFLVVGIYKDDESRENNEAYTSFSTLQIMYGRGNDLSTIEYSFHGLPTQEDNESFERRYQQRLNANHQAAPDDESAIWIWNRFTQAMQMEKGMSILRTSLWVIGLLTLLSGVVGVSNIMLITVKERTHEFGIRKAIGAKPWSILRLIITESIIITTFFGYVGMLLGIAANEYMDATIGHMQVDAGLFKATMFVNPTVGLDVCIETTLVMIIAGTLAGLIPAWKAARIRPIEALRAE